MSHWIWIQRLRSDLSPTVSQNSPEKVDLAGGGSGLVGDGTLVVPGDDGLDDDAKERTAQMMVWTACSRASCSCDETRVELRERR
jgi:hypothetical protein